MVHFHFHFQTDLPIPILKNIWPAQYKIKSEAIDTDQSVALMVAKVTIDTDRWKVRNENVY